MKSKHKIIVLADTRYEIYNIYIYIYKMIVIIVLSNAIFIHDHIFVHNAADQKI